MTVQAFSKSSQCVLLFAFHLDLKEKSMEGGAEKELLTGAFQIGTQQT